MSAFSWRSALPALLIVLGACSDGGGSGQAAMVTLSAMPSSLSISLGQTATLNWTSSNAQSCTASVSATAGGAFSGSVAVSGSQVVAPTAAGSYSYSLQCSGTTGAGNNASLSLTVRPNLLSGLSSMTTIGSTLDPIEKGGNPYGLAIAPVTSGLVNAGDLLVCNFNDGATNTQGLGTTVVGLHPVAGATPYRIAQSASLQGCNAMTALPDGTMAIAAYTANQSPEVSPAGALTTPFASDALANPWGVTYAPAMAMQSAVKPAALYVSNAGTGTIDRISLNGDGQAAFTEIAAGFCVSGAPGAIYAPSGLTYDASIDTLYIVDTSSYSVVALSNVSAIGTDGVVVAGNCSAVTHTPTPALSFSGPAASQARVIAHGGQFNAPISAALLADGDLVVANADIDNPPVTNLLFEISPALGFVGSPIQLDNGAPGALFGLAATTDAQGNQLIYFNDDNANTVNLLSK